MIFLPQRRHEAQRNIIDIFRYENVANICAAAVKFFLLAKPKNIKVRT